MLCACLCAAFMFSQNFRVVNNQKVADGFYPQFTANGSELLYVEGENDEVPVAADESASLCVANEDLELVLYRNGERKVLTPHGDDVNYVWESLSPDRTRILFNTKRGTAICDLDGHELVNLGNLDAPVWFGNNWVVGMFDTHNGHDFTGSAIVIRSADGKRYEMLTDMQEGGMYPTVAPDKGQIAYSTLSGEVRLMQLNLNSDRKKVSTAAMPILRKVAPAPRPKKAPTAVKRNFDDVKIYINPGHGGHGSNDRNMTIYPFKSGDPNGFWESNSNLDKGLKLEEWLLGLGMKVKMSRHTNNDGGGNDSDVLKNWLNNGKITQEQYNDMLANGDDRSLSAIVAEANAYNGDFMLSIHSNAGGPSNYVLELYSGQDQNDTRTYTNPAPRQDESRAISTIIARWLTSNKVTTWSPASRANGWVVGDKTFGYTIMGGWSDGYGVLRRLKIPGVISEGCMHDYIPETYRLMNMDYKWRESFYFMAAFCEYFLNYTLPYGAVGGQVRDWYKKQEFPQMTKIRDSRDELLAICGATVKLMQGDNVIQTYTTDSLYNGVFFFWNVTPGTYTLRTEPDHYYPMDQTIVVTAGDIAYQDMLVNAKRETRPEVVSYSPHVANITDSVDVATDIVLNFNWDMKAEETAAAFSISPATDGTVSFENSYRTLRFHPTRMLEKGTEYTVTLAQTACHPDNNFPNTLAQDFVMQFRTKSRDRLNLLQSYPANGGTEVPVRPSFIMIFDEKVKTSTAKANNLSVVDMQGNTQSINTRSFKYNQLDAPYGFISFETVNALEADKDYKLVIGADLQDQIGVYHNETTEIPFHTANETANHSGTLTDQMEALSFSYDGDAALYVSNASVFLNKERKYAGSAANELKYEFNDPDGVAMYNYTGALLNGNSNCRIGMYVFADFSQNVVQAVWDASGDIQYTPVCTLNYAGWHYEEPDLTVLPQGVDYQFKGLRIVRHEGFMSGKGSIYIDNVWFLRNELTGFNHLATPGISLSPVPANTVVTVRGLEAPAELRLFTPDGREVRSCTGFMMTTGDLPEGLYFMHIAVNNETAVRQVLIAH